MRKCKFEVSLPVSILKEGEAFVAYTPALDLATVGKTFEEAKIHFEEAVHLFFEEIIEKGTLDDVLIDLGWQKKDESFEPPLAVAHQIQNFCIRTPIQ